MLMLNLIDNGYFFEQSDICGLEHVGLDRDRLAPAVHVRLSEPFSFPVGGKLTATRAPAAANAVAIPPPMPLDAPVTIATLSDSLLTIHRCSWSDSYTPNR